MLSGGCSLEPSKGGGREEKEVLEGFLCTVGPAGSAKDAGTCIVRGALDRAQGGVSKGKKRCLRASSAACVAQ